MTVANSSPPKRLFHPFAYEFISEALQCAQEQLGREARANLEDEGDESGHVSGPELLEGVKELGLQRFGMLAPTVFRQWGVNSTYDFGRIVFDLIDRGEMRKTDRDQLSDFRDVYSFHDVFIADYVVDTSIAFRRARGRESGTLP